ncbi:hypothetical protein RB614_21740 [Phytohabitans sp. ZYX-F-186]|uniref:Uncharacterized protein n=1 Tax=Phytohabitans maris TaxID=3071409 RepID=A0ABU0ZJB9_9ACTN|nr:hypothetical protein [Phytohabitans sp. ZYX-F-186]MDQ7907139.1 hypothetical protein [Phytohabitans sp. ZYX-F-186]
MSLAQFALAMLVITAEYSTGAIRSTPRAVPVRGQVAWTGTVLAAGYAVLRKRDA